ncbi:ABC transporter G family member 6-like [Zingiber officinale]|uniref:ABC transporter G family member 5 n=1 Tax=Zingiber officinale TaxID=94328 RepID=A0A8J5ESU7_ZINOF|nr:ABC transporter G family member 6-like [Zingiber officinale]KAG6473645.1 hypothetical protein ZIOFF_067562 [Zingiber officinale]
MAAGSRDRNGNRHVVACDDFSPSFRVEVDLSLFVSGNPPFQFVLAFRDLSYAVPQSGRVSCHRIAAADPEQPLPEKRMLLDSITGEVRTGEVFAVLGASGSGKSTFIDALANRIERTSLGGSITLNGEASDGQLLRVISAYVMQDDLLFPMLTVEETLLFAAELRLPRSVTATKKRERVQALIDQLGLRSAAKTIVGDEGHRGVSGGERRRVSIGTDIIHDPVILFLDEPTSGLDSTSAFMVVKVLQKIARSGSIVVMSVHQPSYRILTLLDRLLLLCRGQTVYSGPPQDLSAFFQQFGRPIPEGQNPTEFALDLVRELQGNEADGAGALVEFNRRWQTRVPTPADEDPLMSLREAMNNSIERGRLFGSTRITVDDGDISPLISSLHKFANPPWKEVLVLSKRAFTNMKRMPEIFAFRLATVIVSAFVLGTIFWRLGNTPRDVTERLGFFAIGITTVVFTCADALPVFIQERYIFMRETAYNTYRRYSYVLCNAIVSFPSQIVLSAAFASLTFFTVGLAGGAEGLLFFFLIVLASFWAGSGFVTFLSGIVSSVVLGYSMAAAILSYFLLFSGFFITRDRIPDYWVWFHYLSVMKYAYEAALLNEFGGNSDKCFSRGVQIFEGTSIGSLPMEAQLRVLGAIGNTLQMNLSSESCIVRGPDVLQQQKVNQLNKWECLVVTFAWGFVFRILFYISLLLGSKNKRR